MTVDDFDQARPALTRSVRARMSTAWRRAALSAGLGMTFFASVGIPIAVASPDTSGATSSESSSSGAPSSGESSSEPSGTSPPRSSAADTPKRTRTSRSEPRSVGIRTRPAATSSRHLDKGETARSPKPTPRATELSDSSGDEQAAGDNSEAAFASSADATDTTLNPSVEQHVTAPIAFSGTVQPDVAPVAASATSKTTFSFWTALVDAVRRELTKFWVNLQRFVAPRNSEQVAEEAEEEEPDVVDEPPPVATDDTFSGTANTSITGNVVANDHAPEGNPIAAQLESGPASGTVTLNSDGTFIYVPTANFTGTDVFQYRAYSGSVGSQLLASVTITVTPAVITEDPPLDRPTVGIQGLSWWVGLTRDQIDDALTKAKAANVTSVRMDFSWSVVEWAEGTYDWSSTDSMVQAVAEHGMTALAMVYDTPTWLSGSSNPHTVPADAAQIQQFATFAAAAAQRYGGVIPEWEVWNEQNIPRFWSVPDAAAYTALLKATYTAIKAVAPEATVIAGGLSPDPSGISSLEFVEGIYAAGGKGYFDALNYHLYGFPNLPTIDPVAAIREVMVANGDAEKKIWITEAGAPTGTGTYAVSEQFQADTIQAILELAAAHNYVGPVYLYTITDTGTDLSDPEANFGLITQDGRLKPAYQVLLEFMTQDDAAENGTISV